MPVTQQCFLCVMSEHTQNISSKYVEDISTICSLSSFSLLLLGPALPDIRFN